MHHSPSLLEHVHRAVAWADGVWVALAGGLAIVGAAILVHTYLRHRGIALRPRQALARSLAALWLLPVVAVAVLVGSRASVVTSARLPESAGVLPSVRANPPDWRGDALTSVDLGSHALASDPEPQWIREVRIEEPSRALVTVSSRQFATIDEAESDAITMSADVLADDVRRHESRVEVHGALPIDLVRDVAVRRQYVETISRSTENAEFTVYRVHLQIELSDHVRREVTPYWTNRMAERRLAGLAALAGFLTLGFGTLAGYLRLDDMTQGQQRGRLRFAAAALVTAGGLFAATIV